MSKGKTDRGNCGFCGISVPYGAKVKPGYCSQACVWREKRSTISPPSPVSGCKWLYLTAGEFSLVDEDVSHAVDVYLWRATSNRRHIHGKVDGVDTKLHHFILGLIGKGHLVDHKNGNVFDNRKQNLRIATPTQNNGNRRKSGNAKLSRFKGVSLRPYGRWETTFRTKYVGCFDTEEEAAMAYDELARKTHGEFACVNFPRPGERSAVAFATILTDNSLDEP